MIDDELYLIAEKYAKKIKKIVEQAKQDGLLLVKMPQDNTLHVISKSKWIHEFEEDGITTLLDDDKLLHEWPYVYI